MAKKTLISTILAIIVLCLCCGFAFAADNGNDNSVNLGNEIMQSIDKTGDSINNMVSGNVVKDAGNTMKDGVNNMMNGEQNMVNSVENGIEKMTDNNATDEARNMNYARDYNVARTDVQGTTNNLSTMTTTTWMWIILVVAAIVIIAAIWYYATQNNS